MKRKASSPTAESTPSPSPKQQRRVQEDGQPRKRVKTAEARKDSTIESLSPEACPTSPSSSLPTSPPSSPTTSSIDLSPGVVAKIKLTEAFQAKDHQRILTRTVQQPNHVVVSERALMAAVMTLYLDYELALPPSQKELLEVVQDIVIKRSKRTIGTGKHKANHFVIDQSKSFALETKIRDKIGLDLLPRLSLLELELEMHLHHVKHCRELYRPRDESDHSPLEELRSSLVKICEL